METPSEIKKKRAAIVTGASDGIGAAIALELARDGFDVVVCPTQLQQLTAIASKLERVKAHVVPLAINLRSHSSVDIAIGAVVDSFGHLDILVNNAGVTLHKLAVDVLPEERGS